MDYTGKAKRQIRITNSHIVSGLVNDDKDSIPVLVHSAYGETSRSYKRRRIEAHHVACATLLLMSLIYLAWRFA